MKLLPSSPEGAQENSPGQRPGYNHPIDPPSPERAKDRGLSCDQAFTQIPFARGGRSFDGADCAGLVLLWLEQNPGMFLPNPWKDIRPPGGFSSLDLESLLAGRLQKRQLERGDVLFFRSAKHKNKIAHVAICLGDHREGERPRAPGIDYGRGEPQILSMDLLGAKIFNGFELLNRIGLTFAGAISPEETNLLCTALSNHELAEPATWVAVIGLVVSIGLAAASAALAPRPDLAALRNQSGRYSFQGLETAISSEIPIPVILGKVTVAGNKIFQSLIDKSLTPPGAHPAAVALVIVWGAGPITEISNLRANGIYFENQALGFNSADPLASGLQVAAQTKAEAWSGTFSFGNYFSSFNHYLGAYTALAPAVDVRASYDRFMPIYGFNGVAYTVFRCFASHFPNGLLNMTVDVKGIAFRTFTTSGFDRTSNSESFTGDGATKEWKLAFDDIEKFTAITVDGVAQTELSETNLGPGAVYHLNKERGIVTFLTAPANTKTVSVTYNYFPHAWSQNPVSHLVYLLTDSRRGKGFDESKIDWIAAADTRDYCDATITWRTGDGPVTGPRFISNYTIDFRKPLQQHLAEILNSFYGYLLIGEGKIKIRARRAGSSVFSFIQSNILAEPTFKPRLLPRSARANRIRAFYHTKETLNAETEAARDDKGDQADREPRVGNGGVIESILKFVAVDNQSQAERLGEMILRDNLLTNWQVQFATNVRGLALEPGDIIDVTHPTQPTWSAKLFRIQAIAVDEHENPLLTCAEYSDSAYL